MPRISCSSSENSTRPQTATCRQRPLLELMYWKLVSSSSLDECTHVEVPLRLSETELHDSVPPLDQEYDRVVGIGTVSTAGTVAITGAVCAIAAREARVASSAAAADAR